MRLDRTPVNGNHELMHPVARLDPHPALDLGVRALARQAPFLQTLEGRNFGEIENVNQLDALRMRLDARVMVHAEITHGMRARRHRARKQRRYSPQIPSLRFLHAVTMVPTNCTTVLDSPE